MGSVRSGAWGAIACALGFALAVPWAHALDAPERPPAPPVVGFEVRAGSARLLQGTDERLVLAGEPLHRIDRAFAVDVPVGARVRLTLGDGGSALVVGPTSVALDPAGPRLVFTTLGALEFESRRAGPEVVLPRGQILRPRRSAFRLDGRPAGRVDFEHRAGAAVELDVGGRFPYELAQGRRIRLPERLDRPGTRAD